MGDRVAAQTEQSQQNKQDKKLYEVLYGGFTVSLSNQFKAQDSLPVVIKMVTVGTYLGM